MPQLRTSHSPSLSEIQTGPTKISAERIRARNLSADVVEAWRRIQRDSDCYISPYFSPEFTQAAMQVRDDVELIVIKTGQEIVGLFPYQRISRHHIEPVGGRLNDVHGLIANDALLAELKGSKFHELIRHTCEAKSIGFHAGRGHDPMFDSYKFCELQSHYLDLASGWDSYYKWAKSNSSTVKRHGQKRRAMERELGELRFEFHSADESLLDQLIELKRAKYQRTKTFDILSVGWARELLKKIHAIQNPKFKGLLSVLWAGDQLVGIHIGMLTDRVLHYWFPVFDPQFAKYSPGTELLLRVAKEACDLGIKKLDLGYGDDPYKFRFSNATESVNCGLVTENMAAFKIAKLRYVWRQRLKHIPMKDSVKSVLRAVYPNFGGWNFK